MMADKQILYEEWFLDISMMFTIHLPIIKFDEEANVYYVNSTVSGSRYLKEIIGEIKIYYKTKVLLIHKMYEIIFDKMSDHFKISDRLINRDGVFENCLNRLLERMFRNSQLQETYSIFLGNVLMPNHQERINIIRNLENLNLMMKLQTLEEYWDVLAINDGVEIKSDDESTTLVEFKTDEDLEIAIELIKSLESRGKLQVLQRIIGLNNHPYMDLYHTESGHYQIIRLGKKGIIEVPNTEYHQYQCYGDKLDLYIIENLMSNPKIIYIENVNEKIKQGQLEYDNRTKRISYQKYKQYRIY